MIHPEPHALAGQTVRIKPEIERIGGRKIRIEDYWDRVYGASWRDANANPACMCYAMRTGTSEFRTPMDDEVLYGKIGASGYLVHVTEIEA
jgi:hypothetical protein